MGANTLSSVANAARLLRSFTSATPSWGVTELSRHLGIAKSSTHRILATLTEQGLLEQDTNTGRYRLSLAVFDLSAAVSTQHSLHEAVLSPMTDLRNATGETVNVAVLDGRQVVYVERLDSPNTLRLFSEIGRRNDAHCTSTGKVLLAHLAPAIRAQLLDGWQLTVHTEHTITSIPVLRDELTKVRRLGYAENRGESEAGVASLAAPIRDRGGRTIAAISVAASVERMDTDRMALTNAVVQSAIITSRRLGQVGAAARPVADREFGDGSP